MSKLEEFLNNKPLYYTEIDTTRMQRAFDSIKSHFEYKKPVIHLVGTNGKGTTGRYLAKYLYLNNKKVGHYTSPHILNFNERVWINDRLISDEELDTTHEKLLSILDKSFVDTLSYFEYTTFIAMLFFISQDVDYIVLEAGLGGEYDATSVFHRDLSLLTTVDFDHIDFLGNSIKDITTTKVNSVTNNLIIGYQKNSEVLDIAKNICNEKKIKCFSIDDFIKNEDLLKISNIKIANYLKNNLKLTISSLKFLGYEDINYDLFSQIDFFGRCQKISKNITIDVGHNLLASIEIVKEFNNKKINLIYNTYKDKDYFSILKTLKPIIEKVLIIDIENIRIENKKILENTLNKLDINFDTFERIEQNKEYLVFGSFSVVEEFLKRHNINER